MYLPKPFKVDDRAALTAFMARYGFAVLVIPGEDGAPVASHLPLLYHPEGGPAGGPESGREASTAGTVVGHMARANPQWRRFLTRSFIEYASRLTGWMQSLRVSKNRSVSPQYVHCQSC